MLACSYNNRVQKRLFFKALCKSPKELSLDAFVGALLLSRPAEVHPDVLCMRVQPGLYKAVGLSGAIADLAQKSCSEIPEPPFDQISQSAGSLRLSSVLGGNVSVSSLQALLDMLAQTNTDDISLDSEVFRTQLAYGKKTSPLPPTSIMKGKEAEGKEAEGKEAEGKEAEGKEAECKEAECKEAEGKEAEGKEAETTEGEDENLVTRAHAEEQVTCEPVGTGHIGEKQTETEVWMPFVLVPALEKGTVVAVASLCAEHLTDLSIPSSVAK